MIDAGRGSAMPSRGVSANNPNSYINHVRDSVSVDRYDIGRRADPAHDRDGPHRRSPATTRTAMTVASLMPVLPLSSFYNEKTQLVWPDNAPTAGELIDKRTISNGQATWSWPRRKSMASLQWPRSWMRTKAAGLSAARAAIRTHPRDPCRPRQLPHVPALAVRIVRQGGKPARTARRHRGPAPRVA